jgi:hypothetical protein
LCIPKDCRDKLREIAARQNLGNPDKVVSGASIAREIICRHLEGVDSLNNTVTEGGKI